MKKKNFLENNSGLQILTSDGFKDFKGIKKTSSSIVITLFFRSGNKITGSPNHLIKISKELFKPLSEIQIGETILPDEEVLSIKKSMGKNITLYDIIGTENEEYISNNIISHNCAFVPENIFESFYASVYPTISSGKDTKIILVSCVVKNTFILDKNNGLKTIEEYIDIKKSGGYLIPSYQITGFNNNIYTGNIVVNNGFQKTIKIKSKYFELECTHNHKLYVCSKEGVYDWKQAKDLSTEDYICGNYNNNIFGNFEDATDFTYERRKSKNDKFIFTDKLTTDFCYFLGLYIAEGCFAEHGVTIVCGDDLSEIFSSLQFPVHRSGIRYSIFSTKLVDFMKFLGFKQTTAPFKEIPSKLMSMSKENIKALLSGLFDGDGCASINYVSTSEKLIDQIRNLLNNFGILSAKRSTIPKERKEGKWKNYNLKKSWTLEIGQFKEDFFNKIGFRIKRKQDKKENLIVMKKHIGNNHDIIPFSFKILKPFIVKYKITDLLSGEGKYKKHFSRQKCINLKNNHSIANVEELKFFFENIVNENLYWDKIKSISHSIEDKETFDFSLPEIYNDSWCHSILYNNIVGHQTPNGVNHYYQLWQDALSNQNTYAPFEVKWSDVPGRDDEWARRTIQDIGQSRFDQEFDNQFFGKSTTIIPNYLLSSLTFKTPLSSTPEIKIFEMPEKDSSYIGIVDVAEGVSGDYSVLTIIKFPKDKDSAFEIVFTFRANTIDTFKFTEIVDTFSRRYNECFLLIEINVFNIAESLYRDYEIENILKTTTTHQKLTTGFYHGPSKFGVKTTESVKKLGLENLIRLLEEKKLIINDFELISELSNLVKSNKTFQARSGSNDDLAMTIILFAWCSTQEGFKELYDAENFARKLNNEYLNSAYSALPGFFLEDGINQNF